MHQFTIGDFERQMLLVLADLYPESEIREITRQLLETVLGCSRTQLLLLGKDNQLSSTEEEQLRSYLLRLSHGHPLQYILGRVDFAGHHLQIHEGALIPRPETEELVSLILSDPACRASKRLLDIGTGSGCIAYALTVGLTAPEGSFAMEVSSEACKVAAKNFDQLLKETQREVTLWKQDLFELVSRQTPPQAPFDLIVSNPPYIHPKEEAEMSPVVLLFEPTLALFAPTEDPISYYRAIAHLIPLGYLAPQGHLWLELNPLYAEDTEQVFHNLLGNSQITTELITDLSGKVRFLHLIYHPTDAR